MTERVGDEMLKLLVREHPNDNIGAMARELQERRQTEKAAVPFVWICDCPNDAWDLLLSDERSFYTHDEDEVTTLLHEGWTITPLYANAAPPEGAK